MNQNKGCTKHTQQKSFNLLTQQQTETKLGDLCPICQENQKFEDLLFQCQQCHREFHNRCIKAWVVQKRQLRQKVTCPNCRCNWDIQVCEEVLLDESNFRIHPKKCSFCGQFPITSDIFTCVNCPNHHLCKQCRVIYPQIIQGTHYIAIHKIYINNPYQLLGNLDLSNLWKILENVPNTMYRKCNICNHSQSRIFKKLACGHIADEKCLNLMRDIGYICPIDYQPTFQGLFNICSKDQTDLMLHKVKTRFNSIRHGSRNTNRIK